MPDPIIDFSVDPTDGSGSLTANLDNLDSELTFNTTTTNFTIKSRVGLYNAGTFTEHTARSQFGAKPIQVVISAQSPTGVIRGSGDVSTRLEVSTSQKTITASSAEATLGGSSGTSSSFNSITATWGAVPLFVSGDSVYVEIRIPTPILLPTLDPTSVSEGGPRIRYKSAIADPVTPIDPFFNQAANQFEGVSPGNLDSQDFIFQLVPGSAVNGPNPHNNHGSVLETEKVIEQLAGKLPDPPKTIIGPDPDRPGLLTILEEQGSRSPGRVGKAVLIQVTDDTDANGASLLGEAIGPLFSAEPGSIDDRINNDYRAAVDRQTGFLTTDENFLFSSVLAPTAPFVPEPPVEEEPPTDGIPPAPPPPLPPTTPLSTLDPFEPHPDGLVLGDASIGKEERCSKSPCNALFPVVAVRPDDTKHIVWQDSRDGNWEIYYDFQANTSGLSASGFSGFCAVTTAGDLTVDDNPICAGTSVEFIPSSTGLYVTSSDDLRIKPGSDLVVDKDAFFDSEQIDVNPGDTLKILAPKKTSDPMIDPFTASKFVVSILKEYKIKEVLGPNTLRLENAIEGDTLSTGLSSIIIRTNTGLLPPIEASESDIGKFKYFYAITKKPLEGSMESFGLGGILGDTIGEDGELLDLPSGVVKFDTGLRDGAIRLTNDSDNSLRPYVISDKFGNTHVFWHDDRTGKFQIFWKVNNGATWSRDIQLTFSDGIAQNVRAAEDPDGIVHFVWEDSRSGTATGPYNIYTAKLDEDTVRAIASGFTNGLYGDQGGSSEFVGTTIVDSVVVTKDTEDITPVLISSFTDSGKFTTAKNADIDIDSDGIASVVWQQNVGELLNTEIFYASFDTAENDPTISVLRVTNASGDSFMPRVAIDNKDSIHVVWHDDRAGRSLTKNFEIFYAKNTNSKELEDATTIATPPSQTINAISGLEFTFKSGFDSSGQGGSDTQLTRSSFNSFWPHMVINAENDLFVFFHSARTANNTHDIYGIMFDQETQEWSSSNFGGTDVRITTRDFESEHVESTIDLSGDIAIVWHDNNDSLGKDSEHEIYCSSLHRESHRSIFNCEELPLMTEISGFEGSCGPDQNTLIIFKKEDGTLGAGPMNNIFKQQCFIIEIETSHPIAYIKNENDAEWSGPIDMQDNLLANGRVRIRHCMSDCNGEKQILIRFSDGEAICEERAFKAFLLADLPIFTVEPFLDAELTDPFPVDDDGIPLVKAGAMYVKVCSSQPLVEPPVIDVFYSGGASLFSLPTVAIDSEDSEPSKPQPEDATQCYMGKLTIKQANRITSFDGDTFIRIRGKDRSGNISGSSINFDNRSTAATADDPFLTIFPIIFNFEAESLGDFINPNFRILNKRTSNAATIQQVSDLTLELLGEKTLEFVIIESDSTLGESITAEYSLAESTEETVGQLEIEFDTVFRSPADFLSGDANVFFSIESSCGSQSLYTSGRSILFRAVHAIDSKILDENALDLSSGGIINRFKVIANYPSKTIDVFISNPNTTDDPVKASTLELDRTCDRGIINALRWTLFSKLDIDPDTGDDPLNIFIDNIKIRKFE